MSYVQYISYNARLYLPHEYHQSIKLVPCWPTVNRCKTIKCTMKLYSKVNFEMIVQVSKFSASSPASPTVLEGKVLFCGSQMGFWSPPVHCLQKCPPIFVLQKIYISPLVHCLQECPSMLSRFAKYQIQPTSLPSLLWFIAHNFLLQTCDLSDLWGVVIWGHLLVPHFAKCVWIRKLLQGSTVAWASYKWALQPL